MIERLKTLDAVRAAATIAVFVFHAGYLFPYATPELVGWHGFVADLGTAGVNAFFVLSGFLLFSQLLAKGPLTAEGVRYYALKRALRIVPLYYVSIFIIFAFFRPEAIAAGNELRAILYNILFLRPIRGAGAPSISLNPVYWTLIAELHFYILLPFFYWLFAKTKNAWPFVLLFSAGFAYRAALAWGVANPTMQMLRLTPANIDFFAWGMLFAWAYAERAPWIARLRSAAAQIALAAGLAAFIYLYDLEFYPTAAYVFAPLVFGPLVALVMVSFLANERTLPGRLLTAAPMLFIAKISYSIYIWHTLVINYFEKTALANMEKFWLSAGATVLVSAASYYVIEKPFLRYKTVKRGGAV